MLTFICHFNNWKHIHSFFENLRLETTVLMKEESSNIDDVFLLATAFKITAPNMKILLSYSL